jgi:dTDP-4-dehydrorhamnose 3,5-epimerase
VAHELRKFVDERGWLAEIYRHDELSQEYYPVMSYISSTAPGVMRGPHEHREQTDLFCFIGPSNFKLRMWDNRPESETYNFMMTLFAGADSPKTVLVPKGIVHAYQNIGTVPGIVISYPNRLYSGAGRSYEVDEIRHEDDPHTIFRMDE